ncbi:MAG: ribosomal protein [Candidatus Saccharibacteria bacterium]|nr:ribosomal protein [Candidatus Saccharibacteria bacterium]
MSTTTTDPIADMLTRIRNAISVRKSEILVPHSKVKESVAELLVKNGFLSKVEVNELGVGKMMKITIYSEDTNPNITSIVRLSKPGRRQYANAGHIPTVKRGRGIVIISTSKGMMTGDEARQEHLGGELMCEVY